MRRLPANTLNLHEISANTLLKSRQVTVVIYRYAPDATTMCW